jgi:hypothetical protein
MLGVPVRAYLRGVVVVVLIVVLIVVVVVIVVVATQQIRTRQLRWYCLILSSSPVTYLCAANHERC